MWNGNIGRAGAFLLAAFIFFADECDVLAAAAGPPPGMRYRVDPARDRVWLLTRDGVFFYDGAAPGKVAVSLPDWQWLRPPYGCLPDLALGPGGEAVITSNVVPTLWRIDPDTLAVSVHPLALDTDADKDFGFSGLAYSPEHGAFFAVSDLHPSLWRIDLALGKARKIPLSAPLPKACGVAVPRRVAGQKAGRPTRLCVRAPQGALAVDLAPDQRSAYVRASFCTDR